MSRNEFLRDIFTVIERRPGKKLADVLDAGHFASDTAADEIAELVGSFVGSAAQ